MIYSIKRSKKIELARLRNDLLKSVKNAEIQLGNPEKETTSYSKKLLIMIKSNLEKTKKDIQLLNKKIK